MRTVGPALAFRALLGVIAVAIFVVPAILIKNAVTDEVDRATEQAGFAGIPANATDIEAGQSLYRQGNFDKALAALEKEAGGNPELLKVGVLPYMAEFQIKQGSGAKGYRFYAKNGEMGAFKVKIIGSGSIEGQQFPYEQLRPGITQKLEAAVKEQGDGLKVTNMNLEKGLTGAPLSWSVNAESDTRTGLVYKARPNGSGLTDPTKFAQRENKVKVPSTPSAPAAPSANEGLKTAECVQKAAGDIARIQACTQ